MLAAWNRGDLGGGPDFSSWLRIVSHFGNLMRPQNQSKQAPAIGLRAASGSDHWSTFAMPIWVSSARLSSICQLSVMRPPVILSRSVATKWTGWPGPWCRRSCR